MEEFIMAKQTHISKLNYKIQKLLADLLAQNGCDNETIEYLLNNGRLYDVMEYIDIEEVVCLC